jgi:ParB family transcriptional regulator, chromosome partitioning protein
MKKAAEKTAGISMAGFQSRPKVFDGQTPPAAKAPDVPPRKFTGVGSVMAAITREAEVSSELVDARAELSDAKAQLAQFDGAVLVRPLDTALIKRSRWANRSEAEFKTAEFQQLKEEISNAGGNVQPIKVRVFDGQTPSYEIVYGHRRYQACVELGLPVNAVVVERMSDTELFAEMDRENRARKNLSAWEQGRMYDDALKSGLFPSVRKLSESLGVNLSDASRAIQLAKLPKEVIGAFASPLDLQVRWAKPLADALQADPDGVLARARTLAKEKGGLVGSEVFDKLIGKVAGLRPTALAVHAGGRQVGEFRVGPKGRATVEIFPGMLTSDRHEELVKHLVSFFKGD